MMKADILIVDDETDIRAMMRGILEDEGYAVREAANSDQAYEQVKAQAPSLVILDIWLQNSRHDGLEILKNLRKANPLIPVLMISGHGTIETAVSALKVGAYDFIEKPFKTDRLLLTIERALEAARLRQENQSLRARTGGPSELTGDSAAMTALRGVVARVAATNSRVLITGEPGTGKDVAARCIHRQSQRSGKPFMILNCAILHPDRLEAELFGTSGALGVLEQADGGTLFLDEVADMPPETQGRIVRLLQEQRFQRPGGGEIDVDVRVVASTNRDLQKAMRDGVFRQDLFYRLNVVPIEMPPLRDRIQDVPALAAWFSDFYSTQSGIAPCVFSDSAIAAMQSYHWPGNVRQLRNVIEWVMIMNGGAPAGQPVRPENLPAEIVSGSPDASVARPGQDVMALPLKEAREMFERSYLESQIRRFGGNISKTAQFVDMERSALHRKLKQLGISPFGRGDSDQPEDQQRKSA